TGFMGAASKPEQGMVSPLERQRHARLAAAMGFEHGHRHLDDGASVPGGAERLAVFDDGGDQVPDGPLVSADERADVRDGLGLSEPGAGDRHPGAGFARGPEGTAREEVGDRFDVDAQIDDPLRADELKSEPGLARAGPGDGVEEDGDAPLGFETSVDFVSGERTGPLGSVFHIGGDDGLPVLQDGGGAGERGAGKMMGEVQQMRTEHPEVEGSPALVLLASGADLEPAADGS